MNALYPVIAVVITAFGAVWLQNKRLSGKVADTDASELWKESASIREDYRDRIQGQNDRIVRLEERVANAESANNSLRERNIELLGKLLDAERSLADCQEKLADVERENQSLRETIRSHIDES